MESGSETFPEEEHNVDVDGGEVRVVAFDAGLGEGGVGYEGVRSGVNVF
jgi:hypothetical protein